MPSAQFEFKENLPHLIAIGVLIIALIIVATQAGLVRCSDLGDSYCDAYYMIMGKPSVLILTGDKGLGDPTVLSRYIQDTRNVPVRTAKIEQLSAGMLKRYNVVIVERAREIPTEKLKIIKDYVFEDFGRLVWVGDAGTEGSSGDQLCKTMKYDVQWDADDGRHKESQTYSVCIEEDLEYPENASVSQTMQTKQEALFNAALARIEKICDEVFQGQLEPLRWEAGFNCINPQYTNTYIMWGNENSFRRVVNPWTRGDYDKPGLEELVPGINFGEDVLGVSFIADDYAVTEYHEYQEGIAALKEQLSIAHSGFVECTKEMPTACDLAKKLVRVESSLENVHDAQNDAETKFTAILTTLNSLETQKKNVNESYTHVTNAIGQIETRLDAIKTVELPDEVPTQSEMNEIKTIQTTIESAIDDIAFARGSEADDVVVTQLEGMESDLTTLAAQASTGISSLESDIASYELCEGEEKNTLQSLIAADTGYEDELKTVMAYSGTEIDDNAAIEFVNIVARSSDFNSLASELEDYNASAVCGDAEDVSKGFAAIVGAIELAGETKTTPGKASEALATLLVADADHELVMGVSSSVDLKKDGFPVPFVLVTTSERKTYTVTQLKTTPAYKEQTLWPAITVKDPKFAIHNFGRGTVVYYAFPPEIDEIFMDNLVDYILY